jgi:hypothetical protein
MKGMNEELKKVQKKAEKIPTDPKKGEGLKPCGKPQSEEAARLNDADDACDEGVH